MLKTVFELGSINQDISIVAPLFPKQGETVNGNGLKLALGGKGANQAVALHHGGAKVQLLAKVGKDAFGENALKALASFGLDTSTVLIDEKESTGTAVIILHDGDNRIILSHGSNYAIKEQELDAFLDKAKPGDFFLSQFENEPGLTLQAFHKAKGKGLFNVWNPSPIGDFDASMLKDIDMLVVNEKELDAVLFKAGASSIHDLPVSRLLMTFGSKGSKYVGPEGTYSIEAKEIEPVDTTGAGDTYLGFFLSAFANGKSIPECLEVATKASALACLKRGASEAIPLLQDCR